MYPDDEFVRTMKWLLSPHSTWQSRQPVVLGGRPRTPDQFTAFACLFPEAPFLRVFCEPPTTPDELQHAVATCALPDNVFVDYRRSTLQRYPYEEPEGLWSMGVRAAQNGGPLMPVGFYALGRNGDQPAGVLWMHPVLPPALFVQSLQWAMGQA